ncbi:ATP-binding cassette domain-containing protein [Candidatus Chlorohelix sp.]|uniref:ABC transporter ATP-binding protein n=1 Tax=Candidatus Chlorohelix sp. TaxID=3139201 RepID=UPI00306D59A9
MIKAENLTKYYGRRKVVREVNFEVERGEIVGLLGPNGAGKTTTMRMITGYLNANSGRAVVAGFDVNENPLEVRKRIGYLPETVPLYNDMTVQAYLDFTAKIRGVPSRDRRRRIVEVMEMCRISDVAGRVIGKLSRGYRQRVGLAQAIVHNPDVIILDEPTVGLDPRQIIEIRHVIRNLAGNHSMILSTHILQEVSTLCDRVIIINQGRVLVDDTLANLERQGQESERLQLEVRGKSPLVLQTLQGLPGITRVNLQQKNDEEPGTINRYTVDGEPGGDPREAIVAALTANGFGLLELKTAVPTLEEIFVKIITEDLPIEDEIETKSDLDEELDEGEEENDEELDEAPVASENEIKQAPSFLSKNKDGELVDPDSSDKRDSDRKK